MDISHDFNNDPVIKSLDGNLNRCLSTFKYIDREVNRAKYFYFNDPLTRLVIMSSVNSSIKEIKDHLAGLIELRKSYLNETYGKDYVLRDEQYLRSEMMKFSFSRSLIEILDNQAVEDILSLDSKN